MYGVERSTYITSMSFASSPIISIINEAKKRGRVTENQETVVIILKAMDSIQAMVRCSSLCCAVGRAQDTKLYYDSPKMEISRLHRRAAQLHHQLSHCPSSFSLNRNLHEPFYCLMV